MAFLFKRHFGGIQPILKDHLDQYQKLWSKHDFFTYTGASIQNIGKAIQLIDVSAKKQNFKHAGQPSAVYEGEFEIKVPYELTAWSGSQDLRKEDQAKLLKELLAAYKQYGDIVTAKDSTGLSNLVYEKEKNYAQALFLDQQGTRNTVPSLTQRNW